uniref:S-acyltransferase n=1 Tax=Oryza punctata TaxID=4537 RepID=A0A0E0MMD0_ORYPU
MASTSAAEPGVRFSDRAARRSSLGLRSMVLLMHVVFVGAVFLLDSAIDRRIREEPWGIRSACYDRLNAVFLHSWFISWVCYRRDESWLGDARNLHQYCHSFKKRQSSPNNGSLNSPLSLPQQQKINPVTSTSSWLQRVADLYPPGSSSSHLVLGTAMTVTNVSFSLIITVFGSEHALGKRTTAGSETILSIWTVALYIDSLRLDVDKAWYDVVPFNITVLHLISYHGRWKDFIGVILLAVLIFILIFLLLLLIFHTYIALTNQTTYEVARRKRIFYMRYGIFRNEFGYANLLVRSGDIHSSCIIRRGIPDKVHPFSKGICRNIYVFCFSRQKGYDLEEVPPLEELEARAAPYTCRDIICCRCC